MSDVQDKSRLESRRSRRRETPSRGDQREQAILDASQQLLAEKRFRDLTASAVASAAGISRPALYFYFGSMEELLVALVKRGLAEVIDELQSIEIPPEATPHEVLRVGLTHTAGIWRSHGDLLKAAAEYEHTIPAVGAEGQELIGRGVDLYLALMTWAADLAGRPAPSDEAARRHAELCMRMVGDSFQHLHERDHDEADERQLVDDLLVVISRALRLDQ